MADVQIRPYCEADIPDMLHVIKAAFAEHEGRIEPPSSAQKKTVAVMHRELQTAEALVAYERGELVGCIFYEQRQFQETDGTRAAEVYFSRLSILPTHRGRGIAWQLVQAVERQAAALGVARISLSVRLALTEHHAYYERMGYQFLRFGIHEGYKEPTFQVMYKTLNFQ